MFRVIFYVLYCFPFFIFATDHDAIANDRAQRFLNAKADTIVDISHHAEILPYVEKTISTFGAENILVVYDIDDCITYPDHPACSPHNFTNRHKVLFHDMTDHLDPVKSSIYWNLHFVDPANKLIEDNFTEVLDQLKLWNVRTLGLTASLAGTLNHPEPNYKRRISILNDLGVKFNAPQEEIIMTEFPEFHRSYPVYCDGVAFSQSSLDYGSATKGEIIMALLKRWDISPKVVFMVDDTEKNLHRVYRVLSEENSIGCYVFKYKNDRIHQDRPISKEDYELFVSDLLLKTDMASR